jgi:coenzyme PQQ biosynthesis protein PqqD
MMLNSIPERSDQLLSRVMEDGTVIVSPEDGQLTVVNEVGSFVWDLIDGQRTVATIIQLVVNHFQATQDQASYDVLAFLETLEQRKLLRWVTES